MSTGSFLDPGILTSSVQPLDIVLNSTILAFLTYPVGYSGSVPQESTPFPTGSAGRGIPTVGQLWPRISC